MYVGETLNMDSCSKFWGNLEGIWGNPGEIPHIGWKIPRVYRVKADISPETAFALTLSNNTGKKGNKQYEFHIAQTKPNTNVTQSYSIPYGLL